MNCAHLYKLGGRLCAPNERYVLTFIIVILHEILIYALIYNIYLVVRIACMRRAGWQM